jgi:hypothetical protein
LDIHQLPILEALRALLMRPCKSILAIGAFSFSDPLIRMHKLAEEAPPHMCHIHLPDMTRREACTFLEGLSSVGYLSPTTAVDRQFVEHKHFMTGGNARLLFESAMYDDIYN